MKNIFVLNDQTKNAIVEISAISGYSQNIIKEIFEYVLMNYAIKMADANKNNDYAGLDIPFVGTLHVKYDGDNVTEDGNLTTNVASYVEFDENFKLMVGSIYDEGYTTLIPSMAKKIEQSIMIASAE